MRTDFFLPPDNGVTPREDSARPQAQIANPAVACHHPEPRGLRHAVADPGTGRRSRLPDSHHLHENVDDIVRHYMQQKPVPGISIAIIHRRGPARFYAYGVTDRVAGQQITWQVGYIGGYASFIGYDRANGNAIVVLQNGATIQALRCWSIWQLRIEWSDSNRCAVKRIASSFLTLSFDERGTVSL